MAKDTRQNSRLFSSSPVLEKTRVRQLLDNVFVQLVAFTCFVAAVVAILVAGVDDGDRHLHESMIGQVAPHTIEASLDFTFSEKDIAATNELREEVARTVPSVFDWHEDLGQNTENQIEEAFSAMRADLAERSREHLAEYSPVDLRQIEAEGTSEEVQRRALIEILPPEDRLRMAQQARSDIFDEKLDVRISRDDFDEFARHGFSSDAEQALATIIDDVMSKLVVADTDLVEQERDRGIYLRRLRGNTPVIEYHITDLDGRFLSLEAASQLIEEAARNHHHLGISSSRLRQAVSATALALLEPNTVFNEAATIDKRQAARNSVADQIVRESFREGQVIVEEGRIVTERDYRIVEEMFAGEETFHTTQVWSGMALTSLLLLIIFFGFGRRNIREFRPGPRDVVFMATTLLIMLLITRVGTTVGHALAEQTGSVPLEAWYLVIPVAAGGMLIRLVLDSEHAIVFTILFAILVGIIAGDSLFFAVFAIMGTLVGITTVQQVKHRMALMWSGMAVGGVNAAVIIGFLLIQGELFQMAALAYILLGFGGGVAAGFFILAVLPVFESVFGYTTDIKLLELANLNQPLLRELILRAPGSYHHSMMVGSLCEAASEAIGCNPLLARVGAYYHDVGKAKNPQYFAENQKAGKNPHDKLKPNMSALIIKAHVKDGLDMARRHRLPAQIQDFIAQHHGTSLIAYFYHRAKQAEDPDIPEVKEKDFRYPGPKPQTRETAICLLADGVEAASRSMSNPSPARLKGLVQKMINAAFTDGQLDECDLTLKDLNKIGDAFTRILTGIYHHRPEYPEDKPEPRDTSGSIGPGESSDDGEAPAQDKTRKTGKHSVRDGDSHHEKDDARRRDHNHSNGRSSSNKAADGNDRGRPSGSVSGSRSG